MGGTVFDDIRIAIISIIHLPAAKEFLLTQFRIIKFPVNIVNRGWTDIAPQNDLINFKIKPAFLRVGLTRPPDHRFATRRKSGHRTFGVTHFFPIDVESRSFRIHHERDVMPRV